MTHGTLETLGFNPIPQAVLPVAEMWGNKSWYFDTPIESLSDQRKLAQFRYNENTSKTMTAIINAPFLEDAANWMGMSPKKLEHLWNGYLGTMGAYALEATDIMLGQWRGDPRQGEVTAHDIPVLKSFYKGDTPSRSSQYVTDLYDRLREVNQIYSSLRAMDASPDKLKFYEKYEKKLATRKTLQGGSKMLRELRKRRALIANNKTMGKGEKQIKINAINRRMLEIGGQVSKRTEKAF